MRSLRRSLGLGFFLFLVAAATAQAATWHSIKGRGGITSQDTVVAQWAQDGNSIRVPKVVVQRAPRGKSVHTLCITRRFWTYGGGAYEPIRDWHVEWSRRDCVRTGLNRQAEFSAFWMPLSSFNAHHFDFVATWRNARTRQLIASGRMDYSEIADYQCQDASDYGKCSVGRFYRNVAGISISF